MFTRRHFLKTGIVGGVVLAGLAGTHGVLWGEAAYPLTTQGLRFITASDSTCLTKLIPVILKGAWEAKPSLQELISGIDFMITRLNPHTQQEIRQLFILLEFAPSRVFSTSIGSWESVTEAKVETFLENWRTHRLELFRSAHTALAKLTMGTFYANPISWQKIGYDGPPQL